MNIIDGYCNSFKIKYVYLDKLFGNRLQVENKGKKVVTDINIFINFESLYNILRKSNIEQAIKACDKKQLQDIYRNTISDFINIAAHYRAYFTKNKIRTNIFYYYNEIPDDYIEYNNTALVPTYRHHFIESINGIDRYTINSLLTNIIPFMSIITEYIDGLYFVGTKRVESSLIPYIIMIENKFPANMNIIITKDQYDYQYCNKNALLISKYANEPIFLSKKNIIRFMRHKNKYKEKEDLININSKLLTFILAFLGDRKRSIVGIDKIGFTSVYNSISNLYKVGYILEDDDNTMSIEYLIEILSNIKSRLSNDNTDYKDLVMRNYRTFDFDYQYSVISKEQKCDILDQLKNRYDYDALMKLNDKYFEFYPLMLIELNQYRKNNDLIEYL